MELKEKPIVYIGSSPSRVEDFLVSDDLEVSLDIPNLLTMTPVQFDQSPLGWRQFDVLAQQAYAHGHMHRVFALFNQQVECIEYYLTHYTDVWPVWPSKDLLRFHQVQLLAFQGKNTQALTLLKALSTTAIGISEAYYKATLAFLQGDEALLADCLKASSDPNYAIIQRLSVALSSHTSYMKAYAPE